jgi:hypothetical protein
MYCVPWALAHATNIRPEIIQVLLHRYSDQVIEEFDGIKLDGPTPLVTLNGDEIEGVMPLVVLDLAPTLGFDTEHLDPDGASAGEWAAKHQTISDAPVLLLIVDDPVDTDKTHMLLARDGKLFDVLNPNGHPPEHHPWGREIVRLGIGLKPI